MSEKINKLLQKHGYMEICSGDRQDEVLIRFMEACMDELKIKPEEDKIEQIKVPVCFGKHSKGCEWAICKECNFEQSCIAWYK